MRQLVISKFFAEMTRQDPMFSLKKSILLPQQQHFFEPQMNLDEGGGETNEQEVHMNKRQR